jgi:DNA-binding MarR family transcriptional regulator
MSLMSVESPTKRARGAETAAGAVPCDTADCAAADLPAAVLIARVARLVRSRLNASLGPSELRQRQLVALSYLRDHGPARQQSLAQSLCMDASSLVCLLNDLEDRDLIARRRDREDRRRGILELTDHGREALAEIDAILAEIDAEILADLDPSERAELRALLGRLHGVGLDA